MIASRWRKPPFVCSARIANANTPVRRPAQTSGMPKSRFSPSAAPMNSARSVAIAITSAWIHREMVTGVGNFARHTSGRFMPVAMPSLALMVWISIAIRFETRITHSSR